MANYMKNTLSREHRLTAQASQERLTQPGTFSTYAKLEPPQRQGPLLDSGEKRNKSASKMQQKDSNSISAFANLANQTAAANYKNTQKLQGTFSVLSFTNVNQKMMIAENQQMEKNLAHRRDRSQRMNERQPGADDAGMIQYTADEQKEIFSQGGNEDDRRQQEMYQKKAMVTGSSTALGKSNVHHKYPGANQNNGAYRVPGPGESGRLQTGVSNVGHTDQI